MQTPDPIEAVLARLMPPAMSEEGQRSIEAMLDALAAEAAPEAASGGWRRWMWAGAAAAGVTLAVGLWAGASEDVGRVLPVVEAAFADAAGEEEGGSLRLLQSTDRIEAVADAGWMGDPDGVAMSAVRIRVVEAETFEDEETGIVVQVSDPRDEVILTPVSVF